MRAMIAIFLRWCGCIGVASVLALSAAPPETDLELVPPTPQTATKETPFVNSFGMAFVPVPITGGPTDSAKSGVRVLFAATDTTVEQYGTFVQATGRSWPKPEFEQKADHPAVNVSWDDATAFCDWLSRREKRAYRLPSDHEWSCAAGIGLREDPNASPRDKEYKVEGYPWGNAWPPPRGTANYADEMLRTSRPDMVIDGYEDGYASTSPVKAFRPNGLGLYDMSGNVWQWCADPYAAAALFAGFRVVRGASFLDSIELYIRSSARWRYGPDTRRASVGFRCVLVVGGG
jgi:formylglycine-generating enzyme required for sulfatase activity